MKTITVFTLLAIVVQLSHADRTDYFKDDLVSKFVTRSAIGNKIKEFLETFKETMKTGNKSLGIPQVDPFYSGHQNIDIDPIDTDYLIEAIGKVDDLHVEGLSDFEVQSADFEIGKKNFSINLRWPNLEGKTLYKISGKIADYIPVVGEGDLTFRATDLIFATNLKLKLDMKHKTIEIIEINNTTISLGTLELHAKGLYDDPDLSEYISDIISKIAPPGVVEYQKELVTQVDKAIFELGNQLLPTFSKIIYDVIMPWHILQSLGHR